MLNTMIAFNNFRQFQQYGCDMGGAMDFAMDLEAIKLNAVPIPETLIQLPWDPKFAWVAW